MARMLGIASIFACIRPRNYKTALFTNRRIIQGLHLNMHAGNCISVVYLAWISFGLVAIKASSPILSSTGSSQRATSPFLLQSSPEGIDCLGASYLPPALFNPLLGHMCGLALLVVIAVPGWGRYVGWLREGWDNRRLCLGLLSLVVALHASITLVRWWPPHSTRPLCAWLSGVSHLSLYSRCMPGPRNATRPHMY